MRRGAQFWVGHLKVGDVVRLIHGALVEDPGAPAISYTLTDGETKKQVPSTRGWRPSHNWEGDFHNPYDTMTVYRVTDEQVYMFRPYLHLLSDGTLSAVGAEHIVVPRDHGGFWYELLR